MLTCGRHNLFFKGSNVYFLVFSRDEENKSDWTQVSIAFSE